MNVKVDLAYTAYMSAQIVPLDPRQHLKSFLSLIKYMQITAEIDAFKAFFSC